MESSLYFGSYARFETVSKEDAAQLLGADNLVGDIFEIEFITAERENIAWLKNRFGARVGFFDSKTSRELSIYEARGWKLRAILSHIAYSELPEPGIYWGEAALLCYRPDGFFDSFVENVSKKITEGVRPDVKLTEEGINRIFESEGEWSPSKTIPLPKLSPGNAYIKTRRSISERLIEQGRRRNKGCYFVSWVFLLGLVAALIFGLRACGVF